MNEPLIWALAFAIFGGFMGLFVGLVAQVPLMLVILRTCLMVILMGTVGAILGLLFRIFELDDVWKAAQENSTLTEVDIGEDPPELNVALSRDQSDDDKLSKA